MADLKFSYDFRPSEIFTNSVVDLHLYITNNTAQSIEFEGGPDSDIIQIGFPKGGGATDLVIDTSFSGKAETQWFNCNKSAGSDYYVITAIRTIPIPPGEEIQVSFLRVPINSTGGTAAVGITEYLGILDPATGQKNIVKVQPQTLSLMAYLQQQIVGLNQSTTLTWYSTGATRVVVTGFATGDKQREFPVKGDRPPYQDNCIVDIAPDKDDTPYTLIAYNGNGNTDPSVQVNVVLFQSKAIILSYDAYKSANLSQDNLVGTDPLMVNQAIFLYWYLKYASGSQLRTPDRRITNPITPMRVTPGEDLVKGYQGNYGDMPDSAPYQLTAFGFKNDNPTRTLSFKLKPVGIAYFKFKDKAADGKLSGVIWLTDPADWPAMEVNLSSQPYKFVIYQPGGAQNTYYLGDNDNHPQIQYFNYAKADADKYTLSWVTANLTSLTLNPGNITIPANQIKDGAQTLKLEAAQYTLTGRAADGSSIVSILRVPFTVS